MTQGLSLGVKNEPAVAAGMAAAKTISVAIWVRVMSPSWAARTNGHATRRLTQRAYLFVKWCAFTPLFVLRRRARGRTALRPDVRGRLFRRRRDRPACGRRAAHGDSRAPTDACYRRRLGAGLARCRRRARSLPAPARAPAHWCARLPARARRNARPG